MKLEPKLITATLCVAVCVVFKMMILDFNQIGSLSDLFFAFCASFGALLAKLDDVILFGSLGWLALLMKP